MHVTDWVNEPYQPGLLRRAVRTGRLAAARPHLTAPHGRVHWAGTETSTEFFGLMEGAIRSGHRVAAEIIKRY